jgi:hypothetical protein
MIRQCETSSSGLPATLNHSDMAPMKISSPYDEPIEGSGNGGTGDWMLKFPTFGNS